MYVTLRCSLRRQVSAINKLSDVGMFFWDYGNAFLLEASRAGIPVALCVRYRTGLSSARAVRSNSDAPRQGRI